MSMPRVACTRSASEVASDEIIKKLQQEIAMLWYENRKLRNENEMLKESFVAQEQHRQQTLQPNKVEISSSRNLADGNTKQRDRKKKEPFGGVAQGYNNNIKDLETKAEAYVFENLPFWEDLNIFNAVLWTIHTPDKDQQILIRAYMAKMVFPDSMAKKEFRATFRSATAQLRYATVLLCMPKMGNQVCSQFVNAFMRRQPQLLEEQAATRKEEIAEEKVVEGIADELET